MARAGEALVPGTRLDDLEIETVLGVGGFGVTYLARDVALDTRRAVKEYLPPDWGTRRGDGTVGPRSKLFEDDYNWGLQRFLDEARILARFDHRNLVRVLRVFEARGTAYMVMEHVDGGTLRAEARGGPLPEARVREVLGALADGLTTVHEAGLLHRDIKPGNVMVRGDGTPVLIDFGSARQAMGQHSRSLTAVITPGYAPIEQYSAQGNQGPWTDIYALGALAYWALSGVEPPDAILRVRRDPLVPVAEAAKTRVSGRLAAAVDQALAVDEEDRPQSLEEWAAVLDGLPFEEIGGGQPQAPTPGAATAAVPPETVPVRRKMVLAAVAAGVLVAILALGFPHGTLTLDLEPAGATVMLPDSGLRYRPGIRLPEGTHRVVVRSPGYEEADRMLEVAGPTQERIVLDRRRPGASAVFVVGGVEMEFAWIPAGSFRMGSTSSGADYDERPVRQVRISQGFWLGQHEVTQGEWEAVMGRNPSFFDGCGSDCPVEQVSWEDVQEYIGQLNAGKGGNPYRLPTEAEWEYAARAGTQGDTYAGNLRILGARNAPVLDGIAWYGGNSGVGYGGGWDCSDWGEKQYGSSRCGPHPVGGKRPNAFGLHDMLGNVWEWVQDRDGEYPDGAATDPAGPSSGSLRVVRGGSWGSYASECRSANRFGSGPGNRYHGLGLGFRLVRTE